MIFRVPALAAFMIAMIAFSFYLLDRSHHVSGIISGGVLAVLNFLVIFWVVRSLLIPAKSFHLFLVICVIIFKMGLWGAVLFLLIVKFGVSGPGVLLGFTVVVFVEIICRLRYLINRNKEDDSWRQVD